MNYLTMYKMASMLLNFEIRCRFYLQRVIKRFHVRDLFVCDRSRFISTLTQFDSWNDFTSNNSWKFQ